MAVYELKNETVSIRIHSMGAELKSLQKLSTGTEYLWKADPAFWGRTSPVLFPFVGSVNNKEYRTKGKTYPMGQHGFARDMEFELLSQTENEIWFGITDSEETREKYPYAFVLKLGYRLLSSGVDVIWQVENPGTEELPFSIGGHPAFNCPVEEGTEKTDYFLSFDCGKEFASTRISNGLAANEKGIYSLDEGYLAVTEHLFDCDTLMLEDSQVEEVALCRADRTPYVTLRSKAPLMAVWSPSPEAPFICIEPWYGRCDRVGFTGDLKEREWGNLIAPEEVWKAGYQILV